MIYKQIKENMHYSIIIIENKNNNLQMNTSDYNAIYLNNIKMNKLKNNIKVKSKNVFNN